MRIQGCESIFNLSKEELIEVAGYFFTMCKNLNSTRLQDTFQDVFDSLVCSLDLAAHAERVVNAFIEDYIKKGILKPLGKVKSDENSENKERLKVVDIIEQSSRRGLVPTFFIPEDLYEEYEEDKQIFVRNRSWAINTEFDANIARIIFVSKREVFSKIIFYTFFTKPTQKNDKFIIPENEDCKLNKDEFLFDINKLLFLKEAFHLSNDEILILRIAYMTSFVKELSDLMQSIIHRRDENSAYFYTLCTDLPANRVRFLLGNEKKLVSFGLINEYGEIVEDAIECMASQNLDVFFKDIVKKDEDKNHYLLDSFPISNEETNLAIRLLSSGGQTNVLLYGPPGVGKTEYARSLISKIGKSALLFKNELEVNSGRRSGINHVVTRLNSLLTLEKKDSIFIIDEAESVLKTRLKLPAFFGSSDNSSLKGIVNNMLDNSTNKVIWILNSTSSIDESTLRRFTYSIRFKELTRPMLCSFAESKLKPIAIDVELEKELVSLCGTYRVSGSSVDNIVKTVKGMDTSSKNSKQIVDDVRRVLEANSSLLHGKKQIRGKVKNSYDLSVLNCSIDAKEIVSMVLNARDFAENNDQDFGGIRMLFYGESGTGKTELARYIAETLNMKICLKRASDILGMYVGENEKNIRKAFEEAEANGDILLFDEADSFFADRNDAVRSWERTLVNEFLTQMEEFSGILICTTNLRKIMDPAMQRRFHILAEFMPLQESGIYKLLRSYFPSYDFSLELCKNLVSYNSVTPGDFEALSEKIRFMPSEAIKNETIIKELCAIQQEKNKRDSKIGF